MRSKKPAFLIEALLFFLAANSLSFLFFKEDPGFIRFSLHPFWIIVLLTATRYGFLPGLTVGALAAAHYLLFILDGLPTRSQIEKMLEAGTLQLPMAFVIIGAFLGEIRQKYIVEERGLRAELEQQEKSLNRIRQNFESVEKTRRLLEARIVGETATIKTLYEISRKFDGVETAEIYEGCLNMLAVHFQVERASIYTADGGYCVLRASHGWEEKQQAEGKLARENTLMEIALTRNKLVTVRDIVSDRESHKYISQYGEVLAMVPLRNEAGEAVGVVNIEKMDFLAFTAQNLHLIELVVEWTGRALSRVETLKSAQARLIFDDEYHLYNFNHFRNVLKGEFARAARFNLPLTASVVKIDRYGFFNEKAQKLIARTVVALMKRHFSETDILFRYRFDGTFAVLSPMKTAKEVSGQFREVSENLKAAIGRELPAGEEAGIIAGCAEFQPAMKDPSELLAPALKDCRLGQLDPRTL